MGYEIRRIILPPHSSTELAANFATELRATTNRPCTVVFSDFENRQYRKPRLIRARDAGAKFLELDTQLYSEVMIRAADSAIGPGNFLYLHSDDDELDLAHPNREWLTEKYPKAQLDWLLLPFEDNFTVNEQAYYSIPSNPSFLGVESPIFAAMLYPTKPGKAHPCPMCEQSSTSKFAARQCRDSACAFAYFPFDSSHDALTVRNVELDAFAYGRCTRETGVKTVSPCKRSLKFVNRIEQCRKCGQLLRAVDGRFSNDLVDNQQSVEEILTALRPIVSRNGRVSRLVSLVKGALGT